MQGARILIVDDEPVVLEFFEAVLTRAGYQVLCATSANECLRILSEELPDLVLLDVMLPDASGIEVCKQIKSDDRTAAILVTHVSGTLTTAENQAEGLEAGADGYLTKPIGPRELLAHVKALLRLKRTEEALGETEKEFRAAFDNAMDGMVIVDDQSLCIDGNPAACSLLGLAREEMLQRRLLDLLKHDSSWTREKWHEFIKRGQESGEFRLHRPEGTPRDIEYTAKASFLEGRHLWVLRDISERKKNQRALQQTHDRLEDRVVQRTAELLTANTFLREEMAERKKTAEALTASEERYRALFENARDPIYVHDLNGMFTSINPAAEQLSGYTRDEILGRHFSDFVAPEYLDKTITNLGEKVAEPTQTAYEVEVVTKDGRRVPVEINSSLIFKNGIAVGVQGVARDITERKRAGEEKTHLLQRIVAAQEEEQRRLSRELHDQTGQSMAALLLGLKSLENSDSFPPTDQGRLRQLQKLTNQLALDVHQLASKLRPPVLDDLGLQTALANYIEEWSERSNVTADLHCNGLIKQRLPTQVETTVYRIVQEALTNVVKHAQASNVSIIVAHRANRVMAIVEDNGCGFEVEAMMNRPSSERRLGLLGMQERVALVAGKLNIESTPGAGTTVIVHIPVSPNQLETDPLEETTRVPGR